MYRVPLAVDTLDEAKRLRSTIAYLLGSKIQQRHPERYPNVDVPEPLPTDKALGQPPNPKAGHSHIGGVIAFRNGGPFTTIHLHYDDEMGATYMLSPGVGWDKHGSIEDFHRYKEAFDQLLDSLGVLHDTYRASCQCGWEKTSNKGYNELVSELRSHNQSHDKRNQFRRSQKITPVESTSSNQPRQKLLKK